jgi:thiol-disulfide isomerase/thioredoxin
MLAMLSMTGSPVAAVEADIDGAMPGRWTMDLDAAKQVAAEKQFPILLDFSGSDWCGWCKLMETNVFLKAEWKAYATNNLMMVLIDFPKDKSLVPEKYVARNEALKTEYGISGYPTFVVLDDDGETELGKLKAGREKTPESFQGELAVLFKNRRAAMAEYMASLSPEGQAAFTVLNEKLEQGKAQKKAAEAEVVALASQIKELDDSISKLEDELTEFRVAQLGEDQLAAFKELKARRDAATSRLADFIAGSPERNDENMKLYQEMVSEIQTLKEQLSKY